VDKKYPLYHRYKREWPLLRAHGWQVWKRYKTKKDRDKAFNCLSKKSVVCDYSKNNPTHDTEVIKNEVV